jgi:hypothetical protein
MSDFSDAPSLRVLTEIGDERKFVCANPRTYLREVRGLVANAGCYIHSVKRATLISAAALIVAEIELIDREQANESNGSSPQNQGAA